MSVDNKIRQTMRSPTIWRISVFAVGLLAIAIGGLVSLTRPYVPTVHDEFSILLAADTLLQGRMSNPTPDLWQPLQTFHVILEPSYASKYPLASGMIAAVGQWCGAAIIGCRLAAGLCCMCVCWMLAGVVPRRWALLGGLLVALHSMMQVTWSQSLISGWFIAAAAALVLGGVLRLRRRVEWAPAAMAGLGVGMLALSRPFEGAVFVCCCAGWLFTTWQTTFQTRFLRSLQCLAYASAPVAIALALTGLQNRATTDSLLRMPYQIHEQSYGVSPLFVFGQQKTPEKMASDSVSPMIEKFHFGWSLESFHQRQGLTGWLVGIPRVLAVMGSYWGLSFAILPLLTSFAWLKYRWGRAVLAAMIPQVLASAAVCWIFPHYLAPMLAWLVLLSVVGMRHAQRQLGQFDPKLKNYVRYLPRVVIAAQVALLLVATVQFQFEPQRPWAVARQSIERDLLAQAGDDLVIVEYDEEHNPHEEWVYNSADLAHSPVIWARGSRADWKRQLIERYGGKRKLWLLRPDTSFTPVRLFGDGLDATAETSSLIESEISENELAEGELGESETGGRLISTGR